MKKKLLTAAILFLAAAGIAKAATPFQFVAGKKGNAKIVFPYGTINGALVWKQAEYDATVVALSVFSGTSTITASLITPSQFELNLTTCTLTGFAEPEDFLAAQTQDGILPYLDELYVRIQTLIGGGFNAKAAKAQRNLDYLNSVAKSLP